MADITKIKAGESLVNFYRAKTVGKKVLITTDHGGWALLNQNDYALLSKGNFKKKPELFALLKEKGIVLTKENLPKIVNAYRDKNSFLWQGTSLHIIVPTLRCNLKCVYCHASSKPANCEGNDMDKTTAKKVVDFIFQSPSKKITIEFQGGEPLLNFSIVKYIINYAQLINKRAGKNLNIAIVTNLTAMDGEKLAFLTKKGVSICTSLDGPANVHDANRRFRIDGPTHKTVTGWIKKIQDSYSKQKITNTRVNALTTITRHSLEYPKEIVDEYLKKGIYSINLRPLNNLGCAKKDWQEIGYGAEEFIKFWKTAMNYILYLNGKGFQIQERMIEIMLQKLFGKNDPNYLDLRSPCGAVIGQILYNFDGKLYSCDEGRMLGDDIFRVGNVKDDDYKKTLTSPESCAIVAASTTDTQFCDSCAFKPFCGVCPVVNYAEQCSLIAKLPQSNRCKILKAQFSWLFEKLQDPVAKKILTERMK